MRSLPCRARASVRRRPRTGGRRRDPRSRSRRRPAGSSLCREVYSVCRRGRRRDLRGWETRRAPTRPVPSCPSGILGCARGRASRWRALGSGCRARRSLRFAPAAFYLGRPLVDLFAGQDGLLDKQLLRRRHPALVVPELPIVLEALYGAAVFVRGFEALYVEGDVDGVRQALPVLGLVLALGYGAAGRAPHIVYAGHALAYPTFRASLIGGRSTSSSTYSCNFKPSGVATACRKSENWKSCSGRFGSLA